MASNLFHLIPLACWLFCPKHVRRSGCGEFSQVSRRPGKGRERKKGKEKNTEKRTKKKE